MRAGALVLAVLLLAVACWTVAPGFERLTLLLAVAVPEAAPLLLAIALPIALLAWWLARGRARTGVAVLAAATAVCLLWPIVAAPFARDAADRALAAANPAFAASPRPRALAEVDVTRDVPVRLRDGTSSGLDLYRPHGAREPALVVTVYGGAFMFGSRAGDETLARWYAQRGYAVAAIDYRHAPRYRFPVQRDDVEDALHTIVARASGWHVDARRVVLFGRSSGASLALLAAERPQPLRVVAAVAYYAPADLVAGWDDPPFPDPLRVRTILSAYLGGSPHDAARAAAYRAASPIDGATPRMPPVFLIAGARDEIVRIEQQRAFATRLRELGVPVVEIELPWANHAFDEVDGLGAAIARDATLRFLDAVLGAP